MAHEDNKKFKLICFDLDGTIIDDITNLWRHITKETGADLKRKDEAYEKYFNNLISYDEWVDHDVNLWKEKDVTRDQLIGICKRLRLMAGALETIKELKRRGVKIGIISDSLAIALEALIPDYEDLFDEVFINWLLFEKDGKIAGWSATPYGIEKKADGLKAMADKGNIPIDECIFVGDGHNDVQVAELSGLSIAFNSSSDDLNKAADVVIRVKDLREILRHIP